MDPSLRIHQTTWAFWVHQSTWGGEEWANFGWVHQKTRVPVIEYCIVECYCTCIIEIQVFFHSAKFDNFKYEKMSDYKIVSVAQSKNLLDCQLWATFEGSFLGKKNILRYCSPNSIIPICTQKKSIEHRICRAAWNSFLV